MRPSQMGLRIVTVFGVLRERAELQVAVSPVLPPPSKTPARCEGGAAKPL